MIAIKAIQPRHYPTLTYKGEPIQVVQSFKYFGVDVPSRNRESMYAMSLDFKQVGIVIICLKINTTKVILEGGM